MEFSLHTGDPTDLNEATYPGYRRVTSDQPINDKTAIIFPPCPITGDTVITHAAVWVHGEMIHVIKYDTPIDSKLMRDRTPRGLWSAMKVDVCLRDIR